MLKLTNVNKYHFITLKMIMIIDDSLPNINNNIMIQCNIVPHGTIRWYQLITYVLEQHLKKKLIHLLKNIHKNLNKHNSS